MNKTKIVIYSSVILYAALMLVGLVITGRTASHIEEHLVGHEHD